VIKQFFVLPVYRWNVKIVILIIIIIRSNFWWRCTRFNAFKIVPVARAVRALLYHRRHLGLRCNEQPGMVIVKTIVSLDRLAEAEKAIKEVITKSVDEITPEELLEAKRALNSSMVNNFATNAGTATMFLAIDRFGFPVNYFDTRAQTLAAVTLDQVKKRWKKYCVMRLCLRSRLEE